MANTTRPQGYLDALAKSYWRVRIDQLKQELRAAASQPSIQVSVQPITYGTGANHKSSKRRTHNDSH